MTDFLIRVVVDPKDAQKGTRVVRTELQEAETAAGKLGRTLRNVFTVAAITLAARELGQLADAYTNIQNRLRTVTDSNDELATATDRLFEISNRTRSSYEATAEVYARTALAARDLGRSQDELLAFTESLNKAVILSGASAQEAQAGLIQLSQGLASGALRGEELRSVLEQIPVVADVIAESLGVTRGELRKLGEDGKLSAQIILDAFRDAREELDERFAESVPTLGQAFTVLRNEVIRFVGDTDKATGASATLAGGILTLAENLDTLATVTSIAGSAFVALKLAPVAAEAATLAQRFIEARVAIAQGRAVALGSAEATRQQAAAAVEAALAERQRTVATLASIEAEQARAVVVGAGTAAGIAQAEAEVAQAAIRARSAQVTLAAAQAEQARLVASSEAVAVLQLAQVSEVEVAAARAANVAATEGLAAAQAQLSAATAAATTTEAAQRAVEAQLATLKGTLAAQTQALAAAQTRLGTATAATTLKHTLLKRAFSVNPFTLLVAGATAAYFSLQKLDEVLDEIEATQRQASQGEFSALSSFGKLGAEVELAKKRVEDLQFVIAKSNRGIGEPANDVQLGQLRRAQEELEKLTKEQERLRASTIKASAEAREQRKALEELQANFQSSKDDINQETRLLALNSREREVQVALLKELDRIQKDGGPQLTPAQTFELALLLNVNAALRDQAAALEQIRGPGEEFERGLSALRGLLSSGQIDLATFNEQVTTLAADLGGLNLDGAQITLSGVESLEEAVAVISALLGKQKELREAEELRAQVIRDVIGPTEELEQRQAILNELIAEGGANADLYRAALAEVEAQLNPLNESQKLQAELLEDIRGPADRFAQVQEALGQLFLDNKITADEYAQAMEEAARASGLFLDSLPEAKIQKIRDDLGIFADQIKGLGDKILDFAVFGSGAWEDFTTSLLLDLQRLLAEKALIALIDAFTGGGFSSSGAAGFLFGGGKAEGGDVNANTPYIVGEEGPELFTPDDAGTITPAGETAALLGQQKQAPVVVNVPPAQVAAYVVSDPSEIPSGIESAAGEAAVMKVITRKKREVRGLIS